MPTVKHPTISAWDRAPVRFAVAVLILLLLHLPLLFLQPPNYRSSLCRPAGSSGAVTALPAGSRLQNHPCLKDLYEWAQVADCSTNYQLNQQSGYLQFVPPAPPRTTPPFPELKLQQLPSPRFSFAVRELAQEALPMGQFILQYWPDYMPPEPIAEPVPWKNGIYWRLYSRGPLKTPPAVNKEELRKVLAGADLSKLVRTTVLEVVFLPELNIPRVVVRQSCGLPELDLLATRAARLEIEKILKSSPGLRKTLRRQSCVIQTDWRLGSAEHDKKN